MFTFGQICLKGLVNVKVHIYETKQTKVLSIFLMIIM